VLFIISGPGGVGKDTVARRVVADDATLSISRSWTTRDPRPEETDADYRFATRDEFLANVERGGFLEWAEYLGNFYGTPKPEVSDGDVILVIEVQGAAQVLDKVPGTVMILLVPPSAEAQEARLRARGDAEDRVQSRLAAARGEIDVGRKLAHHIVVNDDLDRAAAEVAGILASYRKTPS
jgi:guanylate kinase